MFSFLSCNSEGDFSSLKELKTERRCGVAVITNAQFDSVSLNSDTAQVETLLAACQRFLLVRKDLKQSFVGYPLFKINS